MRTAANNGESQLKTGVMANSGIARKAAARGVEKRYKARYKLHIGYGSLPHARKAALAWGMPEGAVFPGAQLIPFVGCVSKRPARRKRVMVHGVDITAEVAAAIPTLRSADERRTLADLESYVAFNRFNIERGEVYFMRVEGGDPSTSPVKIGISQYPGLRACQVENQLEKDYGITVTLEVVATIRGDRNLERYAHMAFRESALGREWFRPSPELLSLIEEARVKDAAIDAGIGGAL
jgi:hypothetical protein